MLYSYNFYIIFSRFFIRFFRIDIDRNPVLISFFCLSKKIRKLQKKDNQDTLARIDIDIKNV